MQIPGSFQFALLGALPPCHPHSGIFLNQCIHRCGWCASRFSGWGDSRRTELGDGESCRRAGYVVHADLLEELDGSRIASMFAADADLDLWVGRSGFEDGG